MQNKTKTYKYITLQFVLSILVLIITIKPAIEFISSLSFCKNKIELNENIDFEDECETEFDEVILNSKPIDFQSQSKSQNRIKFDNYSSQILVMYSDIFLLPPILNS